MPIAQLTWSMDPHTSLFACFASNPSILFLKQGNPNPT